MRSILNTVKTAAKRLPFVGRAQTSVMAKTETVDTVDIDWSQKQISTIPTKDDQGRPHIQLLQGEHGYVRASEAASIGSGAATTCLLLLAKSDEMIGAAHIDNPPGSGELDWLKEMGPGLEVQLVGSYGSSPTSHQIVERVAAEVPTESLGKFVLQDNSAKNGGPLVTDACVTSDGDFLRAEYPAELEEIPAGPYRYGRIFQSERSGNTSGVMAGDLELKVDPYTVNDKEWMRPILHLSDDELQNHYSTSPGHEPPRFASHLRAGVSHLFNQMPATALQTQILKWSSETGWS